MPPPIDPSRGCLGSRRSRRTAAMRNKGNKARPNGLTQHPTGGSPVTVVVVSNRVARAKADEPVAGGLAAALLPMVRDSGAIWVGSSGQADTSQNHDSFAKIEALGSGALATVD